MPKIGSIDVPDLLFEKLVEDTVRGFTDTLFERIEANSTGIDLAEAKEILKENITVDHEALIECVRALVRMHTGDYSSHYFDIQNRVEYQEIMGAVYRAADPISYNSLPVDSKLKEIAGDYLKYLLNEKNILPDVV